MIVPINFLISLNEIDIKHSEIAFSHHGSDKLR